MATSWREAVQEMYGGDRLSLKADEIEKISKKIRKKKGDCVESDTDYRIL